MKSSFITVLNNKIQTPKSKSGSPLLSSVMALIISTALVDSSTDAGLGVSGTRHHARYEDLENAAKNGCNLCKIADSSLTRLSKQQAKINRIRK
jgi:hypothetical protein